ncbi:baseplate J/gp47 family protein [Pedobacter caeni]|uniref:Baseplate J-like protein n=1 Tax=Pedobacter caeni TaxID=288992 RepID=A0A1M4U523_9SPHI|nr:baseplate J/gp47 family protein [Pedobacter caeni]SHE51775.1 Baseplate J-like protein [Pedobacter caeni]
MVCKDLIHPFQNDPGVSQHQRIMDDLLSGSAKIDGRSLADLLDYFVQLSRHINYYDTSLKITDWQPFFQGSLPFAITEILKYDKNKISSKLAFYNALFDKNPNKTSLQLLFRYVFHTVIRPFNTWSLKLKESDLPLELLLDKLIGDKLAAPLKLFITHLNTAVKWYRINSINFNGLMDNEAWGLDIADIYPFLDPDFFKDQGKTKRNRIIALRNAMMEVVPCFLDVVQVLESSAGLSLEQSLFPLKEALKEKHEPHLALLFSFLKLFQHLQGDLNTFTKKHLDFFYKEVLCLKAREANPDQAHVVFDIQNQLNKYLLEKGLLLKDGKDGNKAEILFSLDDEIVVSKAQVSDKRTLFINNQVQGEDTYVEGLYMAPDADKADGIDKAFQEDVPVSWPTLGAKYSKYVDPESKLIRPYPRARIGFVLASPVLLLNEGNRTVTVTLSCNLKKGAYSFLKDGDSKFIDPVDLYEEVQGILGQTFYVFSQDLIDSVLKMKISETMGENLKEILRTLKPKAEKIVSATDFDKIASTLEEKKILLETFKPKKALNVLFSGEKEWISPAEVPEIKLIPVKSTDVFNLVIIAKLLPEQKAVTFYNAEALKEDFTTFMPVLKIELDDRIKLSKEIKSDDREICCKRVVKGGSQDVSLYHFFRNVTVLADTKIVVEVCGLKNFIVQNDESVQNVNGPVYPFGTRPSVIDFNIINPVKDKPGEANKSGGAKKADDAVKSNESDKSEDSNEKKLNLVGPNFYIGSKEVFCKKWNEVHVNLNWKDKPSDFNEYYKGYVRREKHHDCDDPLKNDVEIYGLNECDFEINLALLQDGVWDKELFNLPYTDAISNPKITDYNRKLFSNTVLSPPASGSAYPCEDTYDRTISIISGEIKPAETRQFKLSPKFNIDQEPFENYKADSLDGFLRINLQGQDFLHKNYSYVLARQMMAFGRPAGERLEGAVYYNVENGNLIVFNATNIKDQITDAIDAANVVISEVNGVAQKLGDQGEVPPADILGDDAEDIRKIVYKKTLSEPLNLDLKGDAVTLKGEIEKIKTAIEKNEKFQAVIPNEPWTPIIKNISIDYTATASITDIDLIHLYPYENTFKSEELEQQPALFPTFCDEGSLYLGLKDLQPGSNLNVLFQLAEATADSESDRVNVQWHYLENNFWKPLREGFEVLDDDTDGLTTSGIIKFALPGNMSSENTILPKGLHWIKAAIPISSKSVSETIGVFAQAIKATFTNERANDKLRLGQPLSAGSLAKLNEADSSIKKVSQPFDSFAGRMPEEEGHFYVRISEQLRHKGRGIQKFDYERLVLEAFPQLFKVKCINHSFGLNAHDYINDIPMAPGYVLLAVIPDMNQLKAAQQFEPRVPISLLEDIQEYLNQRISPFVKVWVKNPRYEKLNFSLEVKLYKGKDEQFYKEKLKEDLKTFLAPWAVGEYDKLTFGQPVFMSDIIGFLETRDYLDYIIKLDMWHEEKKPGNTSEQDPVYPITPRSILIAGNIDLHINQQDCDQWRDMSKDVPMYK